MLNGFGIKLQCNKYSEFHGVSTEMHMPAKNSAMSTTTNTNNSGSTSRHKYFVSCKLYK